MLRPRTNQVVSIIDELMQQSNRDQSFTPRSPFPFPSTVPFDMGSSGSSMRTFNKAQDMFNVGGAPTPMDTRSLRSQREPFRPQVNLGDTNFINEQQVTPGFPEITPTDVDMTDRTKPSPMALEAMGEDAAAAMDQETARMGEKALQAFSIENSNEELKSDPTFQERISGFFGDRENMLSLALAFNSMRLQPDQGLAAVIGAELKDLRSKRSDTRSANRTVASLRAIGTKEALQAADMIEANPSLAKEIYGKYVATELEKPGEQRKGETDLRKEFVGNAEVKDFGKQASAFGRVIASAENPSAAGDLALIFNYMKVLDPGSTVREGEFATAQNAAGVPGRVISLYNNLIKGERLNPEQRGDFVSRSRMLFQQAERGFQGIRDQYKSIAQDYGFDLDRAVPDIFSNSSKLANPQITFDQLPAETKQRFPDEASWNAHYQNLPYLEQIRLMRLL